MKKKLSKTLWYGTDVDSNGNPIIPHFTSDPNDLLGLHVGELYLHFHAGKATLWTANESGSIVSIVDGGNIDLSDYLLVSDFNRLWEIRTDSNGNDYIFGKLPVVTQYGITMYADDGSVNIPTIAEGLPFDNRTIWFNPTTKQIEVIGGTGGGSGEGVSNFWDLSGIPSWITNTKPTYSYSEIEDTPDFSKYALVSQIPSLDGYATESWVTNKGYATQSWVESKGYALSSDLTNYIPIQGYTDILGEKNFTGGLKVNGSPIYYDTDKKYWKLEGDLLVTGGVTMYSSDTDFTPSTIMDAIVVDNVTIIKQDGKLVALGGGGVADSVAWGNVLGKPDWITDSAPFINVSGVNVSLGGSITQSALRTALGLGSNAYTSTDYLPLSSYTAADVLVKLKTVDGSGSGLDADLLDGVHLMGKEGLSGIIMSWSRASFSTINQYFGNGNIVVFDPLPTDASSLDLGANTVVVSYGDNSARNHQLAYSIYENYNPKYRRNIDGTWSEWKTFAFTSDNVASATKLQTARTIWGQSFDGTGNVSGILYLGNNNPINANNSSGTSYNILNLNQGNALILGYGTAQAGYGTYIDGYDVFLRYGTSRTTGLLINSSGNVGIGTPNPSDKCEINGNCVAKHFRISNAQIADTNFPSLAMNYGNFISFGGYRAIRGEEAGLVLIAPSPNGGSIIFRPMGNTATSTQTSIDTSGNMLVSGGITMYSARKLKTIQDERGLSLEELKAIKPTRFTWKDGRDNKIHIGGIADDVMKVLPEVIYKTTDDTLTMDYGNAAFAISASLIKPVINHEERIKMLEEENKRLKEEIEILKWNIA